jgi:hypothetical protein
MPEREIMLKNALNYHPYSGKLFWRERPETDFKRKQDWVTWNKRFAGKEALASVTSHGYLCGRFADFGKLYAHRVVFFLLHGRWPSEIDHINGDTFDNRAANLREVSHTDNNRNMKKGRNNTSGVVGVEYLDYVGRWRARIKVDQKNIYLGYFDCFDDAVFARKEAEKTFNFHPNHGR